MSTSAFDRYLCVWLRDGSHLRCIASDEPRLVEAVERVLGITKEPWQATADDSRDDRDSLVSLTSMNGSAVRVLASFVTGWMLTTRETRARERLFDQCLAAEEPKAAPSPEASGNSAATC